MRNRIYNLLGKLNDDDRIQLASLILKAGYAARIDKEQPNGKGKTVYFIEFWEEGSHAPNEG